MLSDLKLIKKYYGEDMHHLCRSLFPTILETDGLLFELISSNFNYSKYLYDDLINNNLIEDFKNYIYSLLDLDKELLDTSKTPFELMDEAGYNLYECKSESDIQSFKKYYDKTEKLCTFRGGRLNTYYVFFAVKKDVDEIKRENFLNPNRQDKYGTSVISIQFYKGSINRVSIKNRYNHKVKNPDATYSNNLENIIPGLTKSFNDYYNLNISNSKFSIEIPNYTEAEDGKLYKYNMEIDNVYYCPSNIIINNGIVNTYPKERYIIMDQFILDVKEKKINKYEFNRFNDSFLDYFDNISKITVTKNEKLKYININNSSAIIILDKENNIIGYKNNNITTIDNHFLSNNVKLKYLRLDKVSDIGYFFCYSNQDIEILSLPSLVNIGTFFFEKNKSLNEKTLTKSR